MGPKKCHECFMNAKIPALDRETEGIPFPQQVPSVQEDEQDLLASAPELVL